jgi:cytidylate kinase
MIIAIDGPAGSGKSTTAKIAAEKLGFIHINTGAMYRGIALKCIQGKINPTDMTEMDNMLSQTEFKFFGKDRADLFMDGVNISSEITTAEVTESVSRISAIPKVREKLVEYQREMADGIDVVLEGRDIGTVVFPNADHKFFLIADIHERAKRRMQEMEEKGEIVSLSALTAELEERDRIDSTREHSPLKKAEDAVEIDTTGLSIEQQVNCIVEIVTKSIK